jgi:chromosome segregation ATPase
MLTLKKQTEAVHQQLAKHQSAHDKRRHQLDIHVAEIQDLRQTIQEQAAELQSTEEERKRITADRVRVAQTVAALEADLHKVRREAEKIRRDVTQLREERAQLQARSKDDRTVVERSQAQIRQLGEDIVLLQNKLRRHEEAASNHICAA